MNLERLVFLCVSLPTLFTCALRDNPYDPSSPLHRGPDLTIAFTFDSTRATSISDNLISGVKAPWAASVQMAQLLL